MARSPLRRTLAVLVALGMFLAGCGGGTPDPGESTGVKGPQLGRLAAVRVTGSGKCDPGVHRLRLGSGHRALLHVTAGGRAGRKALILVLHGAGGASNDGLYAFRGGWGAPGVVMVAPTAQGNTWSALYGTDDDLVTVDRALAQALARCRVNRRRIAVGGFSDGATYALSLGLSRGDLFTAVIALSPGGVIADKRVGKPRIFIAHGTRDHVLPFSRSRDEIVPELRAAGYVVTFRAFRGGHKAPESISRAAVQWFLRG